LIPNGLLLFPKITTQGERCIPRDEAVILMYNHSSNLDPFLLLGYSPLAVKFVFKKSLLYTVPYIFILAWLYGHIPIDRSRREAAINSLTSAGKKIAKYQRSVCIAPEGKRSPNGKLQAFKKGPFYLAKEAGVNIVPVVFFNAFSLWPSGQWLPFCGEIVIRFLPPIKPDETQDIESLSNLVRQEMLRELNNPPKLLEDTGERLFNALAFLLFMTVIFLVVGFTYIGQPEL